MEDAIQVFKLGNDEIKKSLEQKHLGMTLDHNLEFQSHIREASWKHGERLGK